MSTTTWKRDRVNDPEPFLKIGEVAELMGIGPDAVMWLVNEGLLDCAFVTLGGHHRFLKSDVTAAMESEVVQREIERSLRNTEEARRYRESQTPYVRPLREDEQ